MGGKPSKQGSMAPPGQSAQGTDSDPLAGTPFAINPSGDKSLSEPDPVAVAKHQEAVAVKFDVTPHYSKVTDPLETINPITGRSLYFGSRPWRCDDRFQDWIATFASFKSREEIRRSWRVAWQCAGSEFGEQPTVPYTTLNRRQVMFYVDRQEHDMIRDKFFQRFPWSGRESARIMIDDGTKMRVWRHQRELELEAKEGKLDELVAKAADVTTTNPLKAGVDV